MADKKISQLANILGSQVDDANDEIAIVDSSSNETKAITRAELMSSVANVSVDGSITVGGTVDGRDVASDGSKLDGIESGATADQTAGEIKTSYESNADTNAFTDAEQSKLSDIEANADVTDTANVTAAGALMDSELTSEASVKTMDQGVATTDSPEFSGITLPSVNGGPLAGFRNAIINGNFAVNQRGVSGTVTLSAGEYGHDRWKAGASGCTYTFATSANVTTITITAGSLVQVIEGENLFTDTYTLSFTGTSQGKIGGGSFGASGITGSVTGGTNLAIEFNTGTVAQVQLEAGSVATPFERRPVGTELALCQRYFSAHAFVLAAQSFGGSGGALNQISYPVRMRTTPTLSLTVPSGTGGTVVSEGEKLLRQKTLHSAIVLSTVTADAEL